MEPDAFREIAWVYSGSLYGRYLVLERAVDLEGTQAHLAELAGEAPGCTTQTSIDGTITEDCNLGTRARLALANGWNAVLVVGDNTNS